MTASRLARPDLVVAERDLRRMALHCRRDDHEHHHVQEEVWQILEGELEISIGGETRRAGPGMAAIVPADTPHSVLALTDGRALVVDWPLRPEMAPGTP